MRQVYPGIRLRRLASILWILCWRKATHNADIAVKIRKKRDKWRNYRETFIPKCTEVF